MFQTVRTIIKDSVTGKDGESFDVGRLLLAIGSLAMIGFQGYSTYRTGLFDAQGFGIGLGGLLGGGCAGIGWKVNTEPMGPQDFGGMPHDR